MAVYRAVKGDVMGKEVSRFGRKAKQEFAKASEGKDLSDNLKVSEMSRKFKDVVAKQLIDAGIRKQQRIRERFI